MIVRKNQNINVCIIYFFFFQNQSRSLLEALIEAFLDASNGKLKLFLHSSRSVALNDRALRPGSHLSDHHGLDHSRALDQRLVS